MIDFLFSTLTTPFADNLKFQIAIKKELTKSFDFDSLMRNTL